MIVDVFEGIFNKLVPFYTLQVVLNNRLMVFVAWSVIGLAIAFSIVGLPIDNQASDTAIAAALHAYVFVLNIAEVVADVLTLLALCREVGLLALTEVLLCGHVLVLLFLVV